MTRRPNVRNHSMTAESTAGFTPLLTTRDWNEEWKQLQVARRKADSAEFWNKRSASFGSKDAPSHYVTAFLNLLQLDPGDTVFDMGCGNGGLALPLAQAGHPVIAADFSTGMLSRLKADAAAQGLENITPLLMSWADDWDAFGVVEDCADVAFASRSIATEDLKDSLMRLTRVARKRVCVTLSTGASPRADQRMLRDLGLGSELGRDYLYAFNILAQEGLRPSVNYIRSQRVDCFETYQEAYESLERMVMDVTEPLSPARRESALGKLEGWLKADLVENPNAGQLDNKGQAQGRYMLSQPRLLDWAFISWDV